MLSSQVVVGLRHGGLVVLRGGADPVAVHSAAQLALLVDAAAGRTDPHADAVLAELVASGHLRPDDDPADGGDPPSSGHRWPDPEPWPASSPPGGGAGPGDAVRLPRPLVFGVRRDGFVTVDHDGRASPLLDPAHLVALAAALEPHEPAPDERAVTDELLAAGLLERHGAANGPVPDAPAPSPIRSAMGRAVRLQARSRVDPAGTDGRVRVLPIHHDRDVTPLALGSILAFCGAHDGGRLHDTYDLRPDWAAAGRDPLVGDDPVVALASDYLWSHDANRAVSARIKALSPTSLIVHGGPSTPKYEDDLARWLEQNPHVDVVVRGEGEATTAELLAVLAPQLADQVARPVDRRTPLRLDALADVAGVTYRVGDRVVRTPDRDRIADLSTIPSPYLEGLFDAYADGNLFSATIETNRGCPYGCTFCDWGSATMSRVRRFPLDRVLAELDWCAEQRVVAVGIADANFGMLGRDVAIADHVADLHRRHGFPLSVQSSHAKNSVTHLAPIIRTWTEAGLLTEGLLSLQTLDEGTLDVIDRSNIRLDRYAELATEFRQAGLPLVVCLMMGLPGATPASFAADLQSTIDLEVRTQIFTTEMLPNSPMNDPGYRQRHRIVTEQAPTTLARLSTGERPTTQIVVASSSFTRDDHRAMDGLRQLVDAAENGSALRLVARYVRHEAGVLETVLYRSVCDAMAADPEALPLLRHTLDPMRRARYPVSNHLLVTEVAAFVVCRFGVEDDAALRSVVRAQAAILPGCGRALPETIELDHDVVGWHDDVLRAKDVQVAALISDSAADGSAAVSEGRAVDGWPDEVQALRDRGPGVLEVRDPDGVVASLDQIKGFAVGWGDGLQSPLHRDLRRRAIPTG